MELTLIKKTKDMVDLLDKNPTTRKLSGTPKKEYWIQMQLQMEVWDLDECDFLETVFKEYETGLKHFIMMVNLLQEEKIIKERGYGTILS